MVTNITADHLGSDGIDDLDDLTDVKALVAEEIVRGGTVVLNADDPRSAGLAQRAAVRDRNPVVRYFSLSDASPVIMAHRISGGIACLLRDGQLIEARGGEETVLLDADELPGSFGGAAAHLLANALAAAAACRALGVSVKDIRRGFATFTPAEANPGRGNVYQVGEIPLVVDYGHNPAALASMGRLLHEAWGGQPVAAITLPGDRRDDLIEESAATVATWFSRVIVYEDQDLRGREPGEMTRLISSALARHRPDIRIQAAGGPQDALRVCPRAGLTGRSGPAHLREAGPGAGPAGRPGRRALAVRAAGGAGLTGPGSRAGREPRSPPGGPAGAGQPGAPPTWRRPEQIRIKSMKR